MFDQARVIIAVTNKIGKINCQKFTVTDKNARQGSMFENNIDCLKYFYIQSRHDIRIFDKPKKSKKENDDISKLIDSFFILNEDGKVWSFTG